MMYKYLIAIPFSLVVLFRIVHAEVLNTNNIDINLYIPHMAIIDRFDVVQDLYGTDVIRSFTEFNLTHDASYLDIYLSLRTNVPLDANIEYIGVFIDNERVLFNDNEPLVFNPSSLLSNESNPVYLYDIGDGVYSSEGDTHPLLNDIVIKRHARGGLALWHTDQIPVMRFELNITGGE
ncbi:hypothetical protein N9N03_00480 [Chlamydiia bacterium]|nr:hypothetical protein [Chlamydiia bacterium]